MKSSLFCRTQHQEGVTTGRCFSVGFTFSKKEQKARLEALLQDPTKRWKFRPEDLAERKHWGDYISAYEIALRRCSTQWAPWFIVSAGRKWYRDGIVARIVCATLEALDLTYPSEMPGLDKVRID
jgi:polyphosphate kinase 2 (PPK2 family)